jgi:hypothetical protein
MQYTFDSGQSLPAWTGLAIAILLLFGLLFALLGAFLRYVSRAALIGMVREADETDETSVSTGWCIGRSRFLQLLGIDLVIGIPAVIVTSLLIAFGLAPLVLLAAEEQLLTILAIVLTAVLILLVIALLIAMGVALSAVGEMAHRQCVLEGKGVLDSIRDGYQLTRGNLRHVGLVWLLLSALGLVFGAAVVSLGAIAFGLAAAPAAAVYAATEALAPTVLVGLLFSIPRIVLFSLLSGVFEVFRSAVWTLTYMEL